MPKKVADSSQQRKKFIAAARAAECDESEAAFDGKLRKVATAKPKALPKQKRSK